MVRHRFLFFWAGGLSRASSPSSLFFGRDTDPPALPNGMMRCQCASGALTRGCRRRRGSDGPACHGRRVAGRVRRGGDARGLPAAAASDGSGRQPARPLWQRWTTGVAPRDGGRGGGGAAVAAVSAHAPCLAPCVCMCIRPTRICMVPAAWAGGRGCVGGGLGVGRLTAPGSCCHRVTPLHYRQWHGPPFWASRFQRAARASLVDSRDVPSCGVTRTAQRLPPRRVQEDRRGGGGD